MKLGALHVFVGPMFAGKTERLVKEVLFRTYFGEYSGEEIGIYKPSIDTRHADESIISHNGARVGARRISRAAEIDVQKKRIAFFDEVQFFTRPHFDGEILDIIRAMRMAGIDIYCSGLDMDYLGRAFEVTSALMAEASELHRLTARCSFCAAPATHTIRHDVTAERILIGAARTYSPACAGHWAEARRKSMALGA